MVIAIPGCEQRAAEVAGRLSVEVVPATVRQFPDGEIYVRIERDLRGEDVVLVGSLYPDPAERFLTLTFLAATARDRGARKVGLVAPYLAFMRQDAELLPGEGITSRYFARLVSSTVDWLVTVDPHLHRHHSLDGIYTIPTTIARSAPSIARWIATEIDEPILVGPDAESAQWVSAVAADCGAPFLILEKTRRGDRDVSITAPPSGQWNGHTPVVIDDIVSTGKTMIEATRPAARGG